MLRLLVLAALVACISGWSISPKNCGRRPLVSNEENNARIVNGTLSHPGDFGWSVSCNRPSHFCGATLIRDNWIVSAAHCFYNAESRQITVQAIHDRQNPEHWSRSVKSAKIFVHEKYNPNTITNDIALIRLESPLELSDHIVPACIAEKPSDYKSGATSFYDLFHGDEAILTGWGHEQSGGVVTRHKMAVRLDAQTDAWCKAYYGSMYNIDVEVCGGHTESFAGACQGDSGGPWVTQSPIDGRWFNWGTTSWGYGCGKGTVFGRVSNYVDWIREKLALYDDFDLGDENSDN